MAWAVARPFGMETRIRPLKTLQLLLRFRLVETLRSFDEPAKLTYRWVSRLPVRGGMFVTVHWLGKPMYHSNLKSASSSASARVVSVLLLTIPPVVLMFAAIRNQSFLLTCGAAAELLGSLLFVGAARIWRPPVCGSVILITLIGLGWLWFGSHGPLTAFDHACRAVLLSLAIGLLIANDLTRSGVEARRRAVKICRRLQQRTWWPSKTEEFEQLPEVRGLRLVLLDTPEAAIRLFHDPRPEVRLSLFLALQARTYWRSNEAAAVVNAIKAETDPNVRAEGVRALAAAEESLVIGAISGFLRDPHPPVRKAVIQTLLQGPMEKWFLVRETLRSAMADPKFNIHGPLPGAAGLLPALALSDLFNWAGESEPLGGRATATIVAHYSRQLRDENHPSLASELCQQIIDANTPPGLRIELAVMIRELGLFVPQLLDRMTDIDQPSPLRLMAVETLLCHDPHNADAVDVLRGLARHANRETIMEVARLLQTYLRVDMGLSSKQSNMSNRHAAEVTRLVNNWARNTKQSPRLKPGVQESPPPLPATDIPPRRLKSGPPPALIPPAPGESELSDTDRIQF